MHDGVCKGVCALDGTSQRFNQQGENGVCSLSGSDTMWSQMRPDNGWSTETKSSLYRHVTGGNIKCEPHLHNSKMTGMDGTGCIFHNALIIF